MLWPLHCVIKFDNETDNPTIQQMDKLSPAQLLYISTVAGSKIKKKRCGCAVYSDGYYNRKFLRKNTFCRKCDENGWTASFETTKGKR